MNAPLENKLPDLNRWTGAKASAFLKALASHGKVAPAARTVGMSRQAAYRLRARAPKFAELWDIAMLDAARTKAAKRRARKHVHPLLDPDPTPNAALNPTTNALPDHEVTQPPAHGDRRAHLASRVAAARLQKARRQ